MLPKRVHLAATRSTGHSLALLLTLVLAFSSILAHAQQATPHIDASPSEPGTITIHSPNGISGLQFEVTDNAGTILDSGLLDQSYYESSSLVTTPGSIAYLSLWDGFGNFLAASETVADSNGSLHFVIELSADPTLPELLGEPGAEALLTSQSVELVEFKVLVNARRSLIPLPGHQVHLILNGEVIQTVRSDENGESIFLVEPGTFTVLVDPYFHYLGGTVESVTVDANSEPLQFTLRLADYNGKLTIKTSAVRYDYPTVSITNSDGITIAEGILEPSTAGITFWLPHGTNFTISISGSQDWEPVTVSGFSFASSNSTETIDARQRAKANMEITLTVPEGYALPHTALLTLSLPGWEQQVTFANQNGILQETILFGTGNVQYQISAPGFHEASGVFDHVPGPKGRFQIELVPEMPEETPTETPVVTPSETPTETPDVTPSETPVETPVETPEVTPSETPTETPEVTPSETPDVTPSETPTETPEVTPTETPEVTPSETPDVTPSETPTETPEVTPSETPDDPLPTSETVIRLSLPGGESIVGAPYSVYAPVASQFMAEPYLRGVVGQANTITLPGLIPATYRIVVEAESLPTIEFLIYVHNQEITEALVVMDASGVITVSYQGQVDPTQTPPGTAPVNDDVPEDAPTNTQTASDSGSTTTVTGLPETGTNTRVNERSWITPALILAAYTSTLSIIAGITGSRSPSRKRW